MPRPVGSHRRSHIEARFIVVVRSAQRGLVSRNLLGLTDICDVLRVGAERYLGGVIYLLYDVAGEHEMVSGRFSSPAVSGMTSQARWEAWPTLPVDRLAEIDVRRRFPRTPSIRKAALYVGSAPSRRRARFRNAPAAA